MFNSSQFRWWARLEVKLTQLEVIRNSPEKRKADEKACEGGIGEDKNQQEFKYVQLSFLFRYRLASGSQFVPTARPRPLVETQQNHNQTNGRAHTQDQRDGSDFSGGSHESASRSRRCNTR